MEDGFCGGFCYGFCSNRQRPLRPERAAEFDDAASPFDAFPGLRDERDAHEPFARIRAVRRASEERARQNRHIIVGVQTLGELGIVARRALAEIIGKSS